MDLCRKPVLFNPIPHHVLVSAHDERPVSLLSDMEVGKVKGPKLEEHSHLQNQGVLSFEAGTAVDAQYDGLAVVLSMGSVGFVFGYGLKLRHPR